MDLGQVPPLNVEQKPRKWKVKAKSFPLAQKVFRECNKTRKSQSGWKETKTFNFNDSTCFALLALL
jgi:hypothetical protein